MARLGLRRAVFTARAHFERGESTLISEARKRLGISQEELGKRCGVTKGVVSQRENDIGAPKRANARKLATVWGIKPLELEARLSGGRRTDKN